MREDDKEKKMMREDEKTEDIITWKRFKGRRCICMI